MTNIFTSPRALPRKLKHTHTHTTMPNPNLVNYQGDHVDLDAAREKGPDYRTNSPVLHNFETLWITLAFLFLQMPQIRKKSQEAVPFG